MNFFFYIGTDSVYKKAIPIIILSKYNRIPYAYLSKYKTQYFFCFTTATFVSWIRVDGVKILVIFEGSFFFFFFLKVKISIKLLNFVFYLMGYSFFYNLFMSCVLFQYVMKFNNHCAL